MDEKNEQPLRQADWQRKFRRSLLAWYRKNARDLPWRRDISLYRTWISEIMLQQTQVVTVIPYFERFLESFPTIAELAEASEQSVLRHWEGLGYYRRARQLHKAAREIADKHAGEFPTQFEQVLALPGIGRYTAGAILSIAGNQRQPILEANTIRLYCRLLAWQEDPTKSRSQKVLWRFAEEVLPRTACGELNQALMELGSGICKPQQPSCDACPVARLCEARCENIQHRLPVAAKKIKYVDVSEVAVVVRRRGKILLRRCETNERWAGLWDFPRFPTTPNESKSREQDLSRQVEERTGAIVKVGQQFARMKHGVTKYRITLHCHYATFVRGSLSSGSEFVWVSHEQLNDFPLSTTGRKISELLMKKS